MSELQGNLFQTTPHVYKSDVLTHEEKQRVTRSAECVESKILEFFKTHPDELFTPAEVHARVAPQSPLTSIRRGLTNLTTDGLLEKTGEKKQGDYGVSNYCWRLKR